MKNKANERQLLQLLCTHDIDSNIERVGRADCIVRQDEPGMFVISFIRNSRCTWR